MTRCTPRKISLEPENAGSEEENNLNQSIIFRFYVNGRNPKQPPGMYRTLCPMNTGISTASVGGGCLNHQQYATHIFVVGSDPKGSED